jgi:hypothetical protein
VGLITQLTNSRASYDSGAEKQPLLGYRTMLPCLAAQTCSDAELLNRLSS